jgi:serine/threonine protein phosphatase 1
VVYAIGDIHGRADLLSEIFHLIDRTRRNISVSSVEIYLGDYIDRGPDSRRVIDALIARSKIANCVFLRGNHEQMLLNSLSDHSSLASWLALGGQPTLVSYGVSPYALSPQAELAAALPVAHQEFLRDTRPLYSLGKLLFVHAGIRPHVPLSKQKISDLQEIRQPFLTSTAEHPKLVVHGHTPVDEPEVHKNRINLDTGACYTGKLTAAVFLKHQVWFLSTAQVG